MATDRVTSGRPAGVGWLPRVQAIERCYASRCEYLAWLVRLPDGSVLTGAFGQSPRDLTLWPSLDVVLDAFGPNAVIDESPLRHMTPAEAASAVDVTGPDRTPEGPGVAPPIADGCEPSVRSDHEDGGVASRACGPATPVPRSRSTAPARRVRLVAGSESLQAGGA